MIYFKYIVLALAIISVFALLIFALLTKKFFKTIILSAIGGLVTLLILHFSQPLTGFEIGLNPSTVTSACVLGLPGVIAIVIIKIILGI